MISNPRLNVAMCWQLNPPAERYRAGGRQPAPWTLLRSAGVYTDMLAELEQTDSARAVMLLPCDLLERIDDIVSQVRRYRERGETPRQPLLASLVDDTLTGDQLRALLKSYLASPRQRADVHHRWRPDAPAPTSSLQPPQAADDDQDSVYRDILVWSYLHRLATSVLRHDPRARRLVDKRGGFSQADRSDFLDIIGEQLGALLPRLQALAASKRVELGLLSRGKAGSFETELHRFRARIGAAPVGCWHLGRNHTQPAGGSLRWSGVCEGRGPSGSALRQTGADPGPTGSDWQGTGFACLLREELLCQMIEKSYPGWQVADAVANCTWRLEDIANRCHPHQGALVVLAIADNGVWDRYPDGGSAFRRGLYQRLASHPRLRLTTLEQALPLATGAPPRC